MSFRTAPASSFGAARLLARLLAAALRLAMAAAVLAMTAAGLLLLRLSQGPVELPEFGALIRAAVADEPGAPRVGIGRTTLSLGSGGAPSGIRLSDVEVVAADGTPLLAAPELTARFEPGDLLRGRVQPTRIVLSGAQARILRAADGRIRFGLGAGPGVSLGPGEAGGTGTGRDLDAVATIIRGFVGDEPPPRTLAKLRRIDVLDAAIVYEDAVSGRSWRTLGSDLRLFRTPDGARASMRAALTDQHGNRPEISVRATRRAGTGLTEFRLAFDRLQPDDIAEQATSLAWVRLLDAPLAGEIGFAIGRQGELTGLRGEITARDAAVLALPGPLGEVARFRLAFAQPAGDYRLEVEALELEGPALSARLAGAVLLDGADPLRPQALAAQMRIGALALDLPDQFDAPVVFDGGGLLARVLPGSAAVELDHLTLARGPARLTAAGVLRAGAEGPALRLRIGGEGLDVAAVKALWPRAAAANARDWVVGNLIEGAIPEAVAQIELGPERETLAVDFRFEEARSRYLGAMPPIAGAAGRAHVSLDEFHLSLDRGTVTPPGQGPIALDGSRLVFTGLNDPVTPARIALAAEGTVPAVLALIDSPPLGLVRRLGLDLGAIAGQARVETDVAFPLVADLSIDAIAVRARAALSAVRMPLALGQGAPVEIAASRLQLDADTRGMRLTGPVSAAGATVDLDWREDYGGAEGGRRVALTGALTPGLLAAAGAALPPFAGGRAPAELVLSQAGGETGFDLAADLGPAVLSVPALRWDKPAGVEGRLALAGRIGGDGAITLDRIALDGGGLTARGNASLAPDGGLRAAVLGKLALEGRADLAATVRRGGDGAYEIGLSGEYLDLGGYLTEPAETETNGASPLRIAADVARLRLTPKLSVAPASARFEQDGEGTIAVRLEGMAAGRAPFEASYRRRSGRPADVEMTAPDAGALLGALGFFEGGRGGRLRVDARLAPAEGVDIAGEARIADMTVQGAATFGSILAEGGVGEAAEAVEEGGLAFDTIELPFSYTDGVLTIADAIARSPMLAVKVAGTVEEAADRVDLSGVISPAYALTGALDRIPLLGALLSGGEGEGILAMTFRVNGTLGAPRFSVNPLSLLTPGILRGVFSGRARPPSQDFLDRLERAD